MKFQSNFIYFHARKSISKYRLEHYGHFVSASMCLWRPRWGNVCFVAMMSLMVMIITEVINTIKGRYKWKNVKFSSCSGCGITTNLITLELTEIYIIVISRKWYRNYSAFVKGTDWSAVVDSPHNRPEVQSFIIRCCQSDLRRRNAHLA